MTLRRGLALLAGVSLFAGCAESPQSPSAAVVPPSFAAGGRPYLPGEQQPVLDSAHRTYALYPAGEGQNLAQTFTPSSNQWLGYLELPVGCAAGVLLNFKIREGLGGPVLYEANVAGLPSVVDGAFQLIQVFNPAVSPNGIKLHKNREYAFELAAFPGPTATERGCGIITGPAGASSYAGGRGYYSQDPLYGTGFIPMPRGEPTDDEDLAFRTLVR